MNDEIRNKLVIEEYFDWQRRLGALKFTPMKENNFFTETFGEWAIGRIIRLTKTIMNIKPNKAVCLQCVKNAPDNDLSSFCEERCKNGSEFKSL